MTEQLKFHLEKREELKACCQLLSDILEVLYRKDVVRNLSLISQSEPGGRRSSSAVGSCYAAKWLLITEPPLIHFIALEAAVIY